MLTELIEELIGVRITASVLVAVLIAGLIFALAWRALDIWHDSIKQPQTQTQPH